MSPSPYGRCETTRSAGYDPKPCLRHARMRTRTMAYIVQTRMYAITTTHGTGGTPLVLNSEMALFWAIWVLYWELYWELYWAGRRRDFFEGNSNHYSNRPGTN